MGKILLKFADKKNWLTASIIFVLFCIYYTIILYTRVSTDIQAHAFVSYSFVNENGPVTPNFLYFFLVAMFAGFSKYKFLYYASTTLLLAFALSLKYIVNVFYLNKIDEKNKLPKNKIIFLSVSLLFIFSLPGLDFFKNNFYYLGQTPPNVWHNSTVIFLSPFAIILFFEAYSLLTVVTKKKWLIVVFLIILNALIKPSFLFTIIPALFVWVFFEKKERLSKSKLAIIFLCGIGLIIILLQYFLIYILKKPSNDLSHSHSSSVSIEPFAVWKFYSSSIPIAAITSFFFPILSFILAGKILLKDNLVKFATINWLIGVLIFILFVETGASKYDGNFGWQMIIGNYLLFFILSVKFLLLSGSGEITSVKSKILYTTLLLHIVWGLIYFFKIIILKNYA